VIKLSDASSIHGVLFAVFAILEAKKAPDVFSRGFCFAYRQ
jgi:hypothetical protein